MTICKLAYPPGCCCPLTGSRTFHLAVVDSDSVDVDVSEWAGSPTTKLNAQDAAACAAISMVVPDLMETA